MMGVSLVATAQVATSEMKKWHRVIIYFNGPNTSETATVNPFLNYRLDVTFTSPSGKSYRIPGHYAADGNAADSSASSGGKWRVYFTPNEEGLWSYVASFRSGTNIAVNSDPLAGAPVSFDGERGSFYIGPTDKTGRDHRGKGLLRYVGKHYLRFEGTGEYFLKAGANSPENFLAYNEFDGTYDNGGIIPNFLHSYTPHNIDWGAASPTWKNGKGKGIIGALNYLAAKGMNSVYFLTMNVDGDGDDVWPWTSHTERYRFDISKLDQWEIVFSHMDKLGILLHVVTQEQENDQLLDGGGLGTQRKLYYRELISRFGHHLAIIWNLGEENTNTDTQRKAFANYFHVLDAYQHPVVVHTFPDQIGIVFTPLLGFSHFEGPSLQLSDVSLVHSETKKWISNSAQSGRKWFVSQDEIGPARDGVVPDVNDYGHDQIRKQVLWGNLMAGGAGVEWYFGHAWPNSDRNCEDWRSREEMWNLTKRAIDFFRRYLPFQDMVSADYLAAGSYTLAKPGQIYAVYLPNGGSTSLDLGTNTATFTVRWYNPRTGGSLQLGTVRSITGSGLQKIGSAPFSGDAVALIKNTESKLAPTADAYVRDGTYANTNFGTSTAVLIKSAAPDYARQSYLKFNVSNISNIVSAKLRLYGRLSDTSSSNISASVYAVSGTWTEIGITWNNRPASASTALSTVKISDNVDRWYEWDVTDFIKNERLAGHNIVSLVLKNVQLSSAYTSLNSREAASNRPQLVVTSGT
jgi:Domain of unknown function (DUF5060)/Putative collagen-binding domain of a collagenase